MMQSIKFAVKTEPVDVGKLPWHGTIIEIESSDVYDTASHKKGASVKKNGTSAKKVINLSVIPIRAPFQI